MASVVNTENIESKTRFWGTFEIFDFFFMFGYIGINFSLKSSVHPYLQVPYIIFAVIMGLFLTKKNSATRRNFEIIYFLIRKDVSTYRPLTDTQEGENDEREKKYDEE